MESTDLAQLKLIKIALLIRCNLWNWWPRWDCSAMHCRACDLSADSAICAQDTFERLCEEKAGCMALPDALIASVGTKVYQRHARGGWEEDKEWSARLDDGWHLNTVREAAYHALAAVGRDVMHFRPPEEQNDHKVGMLHAGGPD